MENREEQVEALQALRDYNARLVPAMKAVASELRSVRKEDTQEYLMAVIKGMNWEIQIVNGTMELINEKEQQIDKEEVNGIFMEFSDAYQKQDDILMTVCLEEKIIPFFKKLQGITESIVAS